MTRPPIIAPCDICQMPDETPKGVWFERYREHLCSECGTKMLEWDATEADLMTQLAPVVEQWADCWLECGIEPACLVTRSGKHHGPRRQHARCSESGLTCTQKICPPHRVWRGAVN